jgi:hypothetical protein
MMLVSLNVIEALQLALRCFKHVDGMITIFARKAVSKPRIAREYFHWLNGSDRQRVPVEYLYLAL